MISAECRSIPQSQGFTGISIIKFSFCTRIYINILGKVFSIRLFASNVIWGHETHFDRDYFGNPSLVFLSRLKRRDLREDSRYTSFKCRV